MKITLISPNYLIRDKFGGPSDPPLGIACIAAVLEKAGYGVSIIDANAENLAIDSLCLRLKKERPDVVGISCNYSPLHNPTIQIAEAVKKELGCTVVVGGNHATALSEYMMRSCGAIDCVVRGEGEAIFPALLEALAGKKELAEVKGISFRRDEEIIATGDGPLVADLDLLPMAAYHLLPMEKYKRYNVVASRGCPFNCSFCASNVIFRRKIRYRDPGAIVKEITYLRTTFGERHVWFSDDTFTSNSAYTDRLLDTFIRERSTFPWSCLTSVNKVDKGLLQKMKKTGCAYISYGIESGNSEMLKKMGKRITLEEIARTLIDTREAGLKQFGFFIVGFPGESWDTVMDSYKLIYDSPLDGVAFNVLIPLPGTPLMDELLRNNQLKIEEIKWDHLFARTMSESYEAYPAELASRWTRLSSSELIEACMVGHRLPEIFTYVRNAKEK